MSQCILRMVVLLMERPPSPHLSPKSLLLMALLCMCTRALSGSTRP